MHSSACRRGEAMKHHLCFCLLFVSAEAGFIEISRVPLNNVTKDIFGTPLRGVGPAMNLACGTVPSPETRRARSFRVVSTPPCVALGLSEDDACAKRGWIHRCLQGGRPTGACPDLSTKALGDVGRGLPPANAGLASFPCTSRPSKPILWEAGRQSRSVSHQDDGRAASQGGVAPLCRSSAVICDVLGLPGPQIEGPAAHP